MGGARAAEGRRITGSELTIVMVLMYSVDVELASRARTTGYYNLEVSHGS